MSMSKSFIEDNTNIYKITFYKIYLKDSYMFKFASYEKPGILYIYILMMKK